MQKSCVTENGVNSNERVKGETFTVSPARYPDSYRSFSLISRLISLASHL